MSVLNKFTRIFEIKELKERILFTILILAVYRFGAQVVLPGVDATQLANLGKQTTDGLLGLLNAFTGGAFANASVFALGIMPYISASIVVQLLTIAIPYLQKLSSDGESGRKKITQITRWLTILITLVQGPGYIYNLFSILPESAFLMGSSITFVISSVIIISAGCIFAMWLGEKITDRGIGNGISLLIMVGIVATLPQAFLQNLVSRTTGEQGGDLIMVLVELLIWFLVVLASILLVKAVRKIPVQYARRSTDVTAIDMQGARQYIPLKLNSSGVMPIIFAQAIMFVPSLITSSFSNSDSFQSLSASFTDIFSFWYNFVFALLIIVFTFFYTAITVPTSKIADDLKRSGGFVPGKVPGNETSEFLDQIMSYLTLPGSIFLAILAVFPALAFNFIGVQQNWALFFGGTSLLIIVGVAIDTVEQVNSYLLNQNYSSLTKTNRTA